MRYLYTLLLYLFAPIFPIYLLWRARRNPAYLKHWGERYGFLSTNYTSSIWVHTVSVGEALAALPLIRSLHNNFPKLTIVVTTTTPTGRARLCEHIQAFAKIHYFPYDYPWAIRNFIHHINPRALVILETEIWPNLLTLVAAKQLPIIVANARLSERSFKGYSRFSWLFRPVLQKITAVLAQDDAAKQSFITLGVSPDHIYQFGNLKFDFELDPELPRQIKQLKAMLGNRPTWVAASTHDNEEELILSSLPQLLQDFPNTLTFVVPRHPERFSAVLRLAKNHGFAAILYSELEHYTPRTPIIVVDVMGELPLFYGVSDVAFIGGSLIPWGGHNPLEAAALAKPLISGPHFAAFSTINRLLIDHDALTIVGSKEDLMKQLARFCANQNLAHTYGANALDLLEKHRGATARTVAFISKLLSCDSSAS